MFVPNKQIPRLGILGTGIVTLKDFTNVIEVFI